jgi:hypothetical protein
MNQFELKSKFTKEFFEEFQFDAEFRSMFEFMSRGLTPYEAIEHLCKSKKELFRSLERAIENKPTKIIVTTERFEQLKMKKQITVEERNDWENETFNYVIHVTPEEEIEIREKSDRLGGGSLTVQETNYTDKEIEKMESESSNGYMSLIAPYELNKDALKHWEEHGDCFYKGVGLTRLESLENDN